MSTLKIPKIVKRSVEALAADSLRNSIISGVIPAGARITELQIANQLELSRATVRAALNQLAKEGLTQLVPYTGWIVITLTAKDAWELYTLRSSVERLAAQLVAASMDAKKSKRLRQRYEALTQACKGNDENRIAEADFALHREIIALSEHGRLQAQYEVIEQQIRVYIRSSDALIDNPEDIMAQHSPIVEDILAGDSATAGYLSEAHNLTEGRKLSDHLLQSDVLSSADEIRHAETGRLKNLKTRSREAV